MTKTRRDFLKIAGATAIGAGAVLAGTRKVYAQAKTFKGISCIAQYGRTQAPKTKKEVKSL